VAATYFFVSVYFQADPTNEYIRKARANNPALYRQIITQYVVWGGTHVGLLLLACALFGWVGGLKVWSFAFLIPALFSLWTIMLFNYIQHVHTDPWSEHNHSRNFTSRITNFLLFNNALHTAHHEMPGAHWSTLPAKHAEIADQIHPELKRRSFWWWCVSSWLLAPFFPSLGTQQVGRAPFDPPTGEKPVLDSAAVDALESGANVARV
jgi:hypothetical protein